MLTRRDEALTSPMASAESRMARMHAPRVIPSGARLPLAHRAVWQSPKSERYLLFLGIVLAGYALAGRGFAYVGLPPLFIGEIALLVGGFVLLQSCGWTAIWQTPQMLAVSAFVLFALARTAPFLSAYKMDALRDSAIYYYSAFAFIVAGLLVADPRRLFVLLRLYGRFAKLFLVGILITFSVYRFLHYSLPSWPWGGGPIVQVKEGDAMVHLGGVVAFWMSGLAGAMPIGWSMLLALDAACMGVIDRAGVVSFGAAMALGMAHRPRGPIGWRIIGAIGAAVMLLALTGIHVEIPGGKGRELSFDQIVMNVRSTFGDVGSDGLDSTKEWRVEWWNDILHDTFGHVIYSQSGRGQSTHRTWARGRYFWGGKGFGINLADEYGYQVGDRSLRSPHNGHMTILARMGVPGLMLWILVQAAWGLPILSAYYQTRRAGDTRWNALFLFLGAYWLAFLINASFDVYLEGPMGGIWFWCVYGAGAGSLWIYRHRPELMCG